MTNNEPIKVELKVGKNYFWCTCGQSKNQPWCDGRHQGTEFTPLVYKSEETKSAWLCTCKHTGTKPFCDGSHNA